MDSGIWAGASLPRLTDEDKVVLAAALRPGKGKTLGRTTTVLAGLVLLIGLAGVAGWKVDRLELVLSPLWLHWLLLIGVPSLVILAQLWTERRAMRTRFAVRDLASQKAEIPRGYFRIGPYLDTAADRDDFNRADGAHQLVLQWLQRTVAVPLYLTGDSGSGKSSLLNAFVLPLLGVRDWTIVPIRASDDMEAALIEALPGGGWGQTGSMRDRIAEAAQHVEGPLLVVLDQFEEFLIQAPPGRLRAFTDLVAELEARPVPTLKLLLVLPGDFTAELAAAGLPALFHGANTVRIGSFPVDAARSLLMSTKAGLPDRLADRLLAAAAALDKTPGMINPVTLNVLGFILKRRELTDLAPNGADRLVRDYIARIVDGSVIRDRSRQVLKGLISARATTRARSETDLASEAALCVPEVRAVLTALTAAGLARPLSHGFWELSHNFVVKAVAAHLKTSPPEAWRRAGRFAAPVLLALIVPASLALFTWNRLPAEPVKATSENIWSPTGEGRAVATLEKSGITLSMPMGRATASWTSRDRAVDLAVSAPILQRLGVRDLRLMAAPIEDIGPLGTMTGLQALNLSYTFAANIEPLQTLTQLQSLDLAGTQAANLAALESMKELRSLDLAGTPTANLKSLQNLSMLRSLDLSRTAVTNLDALRKLTELESLDLTNTQVATLEPLRDMKALRSLDLTGTKVTVLTPVADLAELRSLKLWRTPAKNLEPLRGLKQLQMLDVSATPIASIEPLQGLTELHSLFLSETAVTNLEPLRGLKQLRTLDVSATQIAGVEPLQGLRALRTLDLSGTTVKDLKPLQGLAALSLLDLRLSAVPSQEIDSFIRARVAMGLQAVEILR